MSSVAANRLPAEPLPENIKSTQPGGGYCNSIELAWGRLRRWYLRTFRRRYINRMAALRVGELNGCPHEVLDPRDLKFIKNQTECHWRPEDDPFRWREKIPLARWGLAEVQLMGWPLLAITIALAIYLVARGHHHRRTIPARRLLLPRSPAPHPARTRPTGLARRRQSNRNHPVGSRRFRRRPRRPHRHLPHAL